MILPDSLYDVKPTQDEDSLYRRVRKSQR